MVGLHGHTVGPELRSFFEEGPPAGVILFARNIEDATQVSDLNRELRSLWPSDAPTPLIAIDQEGGRVRRLRAPATPDVSPWPPMRAVGDTTDPDLAAAVGQVMGAQLASLGFNLDFAPVLDVDSNPDNPVIGGRAFGSDPDTVATMALAFARGLQAADVLACGKHFPGHGDTDTDSHLTLPRLSHTRERLDTVELVPFERAVTSGDFHCMMTAHIVFEALDATTPATLSPHVLPELLRRRMGYDGVVVTDDLEMAAIANNFEPPAIASGGAAADVDLFLVCHRLDYARAIRDAIAEWPDERLRRSQARLEALRSRAGDHAARPWPGELPDQARGAEIAQQQGWATAQDEARKAAASNEVA